MFKSPLGDFIFFAFILIMTQIVTNYVFEEEPLSLIELFTLKKCISLFIGAVVGTIFMYFIKRSKFIKSIDKK